jgi:hypothetical protein
MLGLDVIERWVDLTKLHAKIADHHIDRINRRVGPLSDDELVHELAGLPITSCRSWRCSGQKGVQDDPLSYRYADRLVLPEGLTNRISEQITILDGLQGFEIVAALRAVLEAWWTSAGVALLAPGVRCGPRH